MSIKETPKPFPTCLRYFCSRSFFSFFPFSAISRQKWPFVTLSEIQTDMQTGRFLAQRKENGEQMGAAGKSSAFFSLSFLDERDANGTWEIDADANAEIRTKKANETAGQE